MLFQLLMFISGAHFYFHVFIERFIQNIFVTSMSANMQANSMARVADFEMEIELFLVAEKYKSLVAEAGRRLLELSQRGACYILEHRAEYCYLLEIIIQETRENTSVYLEWPWRRGREVILLVPLYVQTWFMSLTYLLSNWRAG